MFIKIPLGLWHEAGILLVKLKAEDNKYICSNDGLFLL